MITKSLRASPVSRLVNSFRSSGVARSFLRNNGKRAGFLPAPLRLPPWVGLGTAASLALRILDVGLQFYAAIIATMGFAKNPLRLLCIFVCVVGFIGRIIEAGAQGGGFFSQTRCLLKINCVHRIIPFLLGMNTVYYNQDNLSRVKSKLVWGYSL